MNLNFRIRLNYLSRIDFHMVMHTLKEGKRFLVYCELCHMVVDAKQKVQQKAKTSIGDKNMNLNLQSPIEFLYCVDLHMIMLTLNQTGLFPFHCKLYRMVFDVKQKFQSETKSPSGDKIMNLKFLSRIEFPTAKLTVENTKLLIYCKYYHMVVDAKQKN